MTIKEAFEKLVDTTAAAMKNPFFVMRKLHSAFVDIADNIEGGGGGGSTVEVTQVLESGTKIATITVDDTPTDLYAPSQLHEYSTTEKVVGKWSDGSDLYEVQINATTPSAADTSSTIYSFSSAVDVKLFEGSILDGNSTYGINTYWDTDTHSRTWTNVSDGVTNIRCNCKGSLTLNKPIRLVVKYTKPAS